MADEESDSQEDAARLRDNLHIYEGLRLAHERWPEVASVAFESETPHDLAAALVDLLGIDAVQASAVGNAELRRASTREREVVTKQIADLRLKLRSIGYPNF